MLQAQRRCGSRDCESPSGDSPYLFEADSSDSEVFANPVWCYRVLLVLIPAVQLAYHQADNPPSPTPPSWLHPSQHPSLPIAPGNPRADSVLFQFLPRCRNGMGSLCFSQAHERLAMWDNGSGHLETLGSAKKAVHEREDFLLCWLHEWDSLAPDG